MYTNVEKQNRKVTKTQQLGHAIAGVGQNFVFNFWNGFIMIFFTDVFKLSPVFVGTLLFATRFADAFVDPIVGFVADRTRTRWGRFRPWLLFLPVPMAIGLIMNFSVPHLTGVSAMVYATVTYLIMSVLFSCIEIPYWSLPAAMTEDPNVRTSIIATSRLASTVAGLAVGIGVAPMLTAFGHGDPTQGYQIVAIIIAILAGVLYLTGFALIKEHVLPATEKIEFKKAAKAVFSNKPLLLLAIFNLLNSTAIFTKFNIQNYYAQYNLGSLNYVALLSIVLLPGTIIGSLLATPLCKRFEKKTILIVSNLYTAILGLILFFAGYNSVTFVLIILGLQGLQLGVMSVVASSMVADTIEYAEWKTGQRNEGVITSSNSFVTKFSTAISAGLIGVILSITNYVPNVQQHAGTLMGIHATMSIVPAITALISILPLLIYDLNNKKYAEIVAILKDKRDDKE
ncbi:MFS transporter [Paenibacillus terrigena]|uniref:MFS transporter n=1 Tax=Paenibacillus terrigena TaxID=369333 RepID=UPI0028D4716D|nr:MFS transporter [Paenibacillus terrigena]